MSRKGGGAFAHGYARELLHVNQPYQGICHASSVGRRSPLLGGRGNLGSALVPALAYLRGPLLFLLFVKVVAKPASAAMLREEIGSIDFALVHVRVRPAVLASVSLAVSVALR